MDEQSTSPDVEATLALFREMDRDWDIDAVAAHLSPDIVWEEPGGMLGAANGVAEVRQLLRSWWALWEDHHHDVQEAHDFGQGVVFVAVREGGRPFGSDARLQERISFVLQWLDDRVVRLSTYRDIDEGRAAAESRAHERADG
jgi:ketosteroid isomerase-like protein